jgi:hypothetical protein
MRKTATVESSSRNAFAFDTFTSKAPITDRPCRAILAHDRSRPIHAARPCRDAPRSQPSPSQPPGPAKPSYRFVNHRSPGRGTATGWRGSTPALGRTQLPGAGRGFDRARDGVGPNPIERLLKSGAERRVWRD